MTGVADVPQADRAVVRGAGEGAAVGAEDRAAHPARMAEQRLAEGFRAAGFADVPQADRAVVAGGGQELAVGAEGGQVDGAGVAEEGGGQRGVHDGEQAVGGALVVGAQPVRHQVELRRQRRVGVLDPVRLGDHLLEHGVVALLPGHHRRTHGHQRQHHQRRHRAPADQQGAPAQPYRGGQELHRAAGQEGVTGGLRPGVRLVETRAPVEQGGVAVGVIPGPAVLLQALAQQVAAAVLVDPLAQPGPGVQQRLVGDLHGLRVEGDQTGLDQRFEGLLRLVGVRRLRRELAPGAASARGLGVLAEAHQPQQQ